MDMVIRGGIAGIVGYTACSAVNLALYSLRLLPYTGFHYNVLFFHAAGTPFTPLTWTSGILAGYVAAAFVGVIISYLIDRTGPDYAWLKGAGIGAALWPVHVAIIPALFAPRLYSVLPPIMVFACFFLEALFGTVTGQTVKYLGIRGRVKP